MFFGVPDLRSLLFQLEPAAFAVIPTRADTVLANIYRFHDYLALSLLYYHEIGSKQSLKVMKAKKC